jgi:hypothetical protein
VPVVLRASHAANFLLAARFQPMLSSHDARLPEARG